MSAWKSIAKEAFTQTFLVAKFLGFLHLTNNYLFSPTLVYGPSMLPTLNLTGDVLLVEHVSHRFQKVGPGDVVLVRSPLDPTKMVTKRIVGMEGDQINFLPDPSITDICRTIMVPKGHIWIQGDNMHASCDSRHYGPVPYGLVQGKLFFREFREAEDPNKPNFAQLVHYKSLAAIHHDSFPTAVSLGIQWQEVTNESDSRNS